MQHHQPKSDIMFTSSPSQHSTTEQVTEQTEYITVKRTTQDEAKTKQIAKNILNSSIKRFSRDRQQSNLMQEYLDSVLNMVDGLRFTRPSRLLRKDISMQQIDVLIEELKERIETNVNRSKLKKKAILEMTLSLESIELQNNKIYQQFIQTREEATQRSKWLLYLKELEEKIAELEENRNKMQEKVQPKERILQSLKEQIAKKVAESAISKQMIKSRQQDIQKMLLRLRQLQRQYAQLCSKKIPYRSEMIRCMFLVAMLCQQNYAYSLKKKHKWSEKSMPASQASEKFAKIHEHLKDRTISIDCNKSLLTHIRTLSAIYIHCKSLMLGASFINNYCFFSTQYRLLYNYQLYERYLNNLVQKTRLNEGWRKTRNELHQNVSKVSKIKLVIDVRQQQVEFLKYIMQVFLEDDRYFIHLGEQKMLLEIQAEPNMTEQEQLQICYLKLDLQHLNS